jgi:hypothetical protein
MAAQLAKHSDRTLFLPPLTKPEGSRTDDEDKKVLWSKIIDMDEHAESVDILDGGRGVTPKRFSELTLSTKWDLNDLEREECCLSDIVTSSVMVEWNSAVVSRSPQNLFRMHLRSQRPAVCRLNWCHWNGIPLVASSMCQDHPRRRAQDFENCGWESDQQRDACLFAAAVFWDNGRLF